ncbi:MAG TPA: sterol desaturase family protein [Burkholderiaceae bacterium]|nr:sterol desaturase family protein [Burkholderiaceae bacterium]
MQEILERLSPLIFVVAFAAFWTWEWIDAARAAPGERGRKGSNLALTAINFVLAGVIASVLVGASGWVAQQHWGLAGVQWPQWLVVLLGVLALDLTEYARHRISHRIPLLWRLHRVHHTDVQVDVTTSLRSHPLEQALRPLFDAAAVLLVGIAPLTLAVHALLQIATLLFQHANIALPPRLDRFIAMLTPTPAYHVVHHSRRRFQTDSNYGACFTVWDRLFGTLQPAAPEIPLGLDGFDAARDRSLAGLLANPWRDAPRSA